MPRRTREAARELNLKTVRLEVETLLQAKFGDTSEMGPLIEAVSVLAFDDSIDDLDLALRKTLIAWCAQIDPDHEIASPAPTVVEDPLPDSWNHELVRPSDGLDVLGPSATWLAHENNGYNDEDKPMLTRGWECMKCHRVYKTMDLALRCRHKRHRWNSKDICKDCGLHKITQSYGGFTTVHYETPAAPGRPPVHVKLAPPCPFFS